MLIVFIPLFLIFSSTTNLLESKIIEEHHFQIIEKEFEIKTAIDGFTSIVLTLRDLPPIQGILRSQETGIDPLDGSSIEEWRQRLETIFSRIIEVNPQVDNVRYIGKDGGELVRVNSDQGNPLVVSLSNLQNKGHRTYFQEGIRIRNDEIYISDIELNVEHGVIETPHKPVLRIATPVFTDGGVQGIIVINVRLNNIFEFVSLTPIGQIIMIDEDGDFVIHPDEEKRFSSQLRTDFNYFTEHPILEKNIREKEEEDFYDSEHQEFLIWRKVHYNPSDNGSYWTIFSVIEREDLRAPIKKLLNQAILIALLAVGVASFLIFLFISRAFRPLVVLTDIINEISQGNTNVTIDPSLKTSRNEIGKLAQAFDRTIVSLKLAMNKSSKKEENKNAK